MPNCMGAGPPAGDRTRPARRRSSDGGGLQVVGPVRDQLVGHHVDGRPRLFEHRVADQRLIAPRPLLHLEEDHLVDDPPESFDLEPERSPDVAPDDALIRGLEIDRGHRLQIAQLLLPGGREDQSGRARVDECAEALPARRVSVVRHGDLHEDFSHRWRPPREEWPDSVHTSTSLQCLESSYHGRTCPARPAAPAPSLPCTASSSSPRCSARSPTPPVLRRRPLASLAQALALLLAMAPVAGAGSLLTPIAPVPHALPRGVARGRTLALGRAALAELRTRTTAVVPDFPLGRDATA